jgi:hypothetical protein
MNQNIMERAISMLSDAKLDKRFWVEVICTSSYLINRSPCKALDSTPYEVWKGKKPFVSYLMVFDYEAFVHVPKDHRSRLDTKGKKFIFIGYGENVKGYKL